MNKLLKNVLYLTFMVVAFIGTRAMADEELINPDQCGDCSCTGCRTCADGSCTCPPTKC
jgi:hypothetical protein